MTEPTEHFNINPEYDMRHFFLTILGTIIGIFLFFFLFIVVIMMIGATASIGQGSKKSSEYVLTLDLRSPLQDHASGNALFGQQPNSVVHTVRALNSAKDDNAVKGLFIRANEWGMVPASAEEIRLAIKDFKDSGKFVVTHSQGFMGTSVMPYMAVSASDEIWQQASSDFSVAGIRSETGFYGGVFEKYDAQAQFEQFHEYKSAANVYTQSDFTEPHREATTSYLTSLYNTAVSHIARDRGLSEAEVKSFLTAAPHSAEAALEAGYTDKLGHYQTAMDYVQEKAGGESVDFKKIKNYTPKTSYTAPVIAFIGGQGPVVQGPSADGSNPFDTSVRMGGDTIAAAIHDAADDDKVKAIVFRVSTPGGSAIASDQINHAVETAQEAGKPVIISMGQYAASGGYYVSAQADSIVAMPTTITGSIGVLGGKIALRDTLAKIGYNVEDINIGGEFVSAYSGDEPWTQSQRAAFRQQMSDIYDDFTELVADGRDMPLERVQEIAKGRVWTGAQGQELDLVDTQGGLMRAIEIARELAEIDEDSEIRLKVFPRPKSTQEQLEELFGTAQAAKADLESLREIANLPEVKAVLKARQRFDVGQELMADFPDIQ